MTTLEALVRKHPVATYVVITFTISWSGVLVVIGGHTGVTGVKAQDNTMFPLALLAMVAGPGATSLLLTGLIDGRQGLRDLRSRLLTWRLGIAWYAIALLAAPLVATAATLTLSRFSPEFLPGLVVADDRRSVLLFGVVVGLIAGVVEELGWTGFAIPRLRQRYGVLATGLIVGLLWSAWHVLVIVWGIGDRAGTIPLALFVIVDGLAGLLAFRVLMVFVYDRTESLCLGMLMHVSLTATTLILTPLTTGGQLLTYGLAFAAATWGVIALVAGASIQHPGQLRSRAT